MTGIRLYDLLTAKRNPANPGEISDADLLETILEDRGAANAVLELIEHDLSRLPALDLRIIGGIDGMGKGRAGRLIAAFLLGLRIAESMAHSSETPELELA